MSAPGRRAGGCEPATSRAALDLPILSDVAAGLTPHQFSVEEWRRLARAGALDPPVRAELIEGQVMDMAPTGRRHLACVDRLIALLVPAAGDQALVCAYQPIRLDEHSEPCPDLVLLRDPHGGLVGAPGAGSVLLVVEVVDGSMAREVEAKCVLYARGGVEQAWMVDLDREDVMVLRRPSRTGYRHLRRAQAGEVLDVPGLAGVAVAVDLLMLQPAARQLSG